MEVGMELGKVKKRGEDPPFFVLFLFCFVAFHFWKRWKFVLGLPKWEFSTGKKTFHAGEKKSGKLTLPPSEKYACYTPPRNCPVLIALQINSSPLCQTNNVIDLSTSSHVSWWQNVKSKAPHIQIFYMSTFQRGNFSCTIDNSKLSICVTDDPRTVGMPTSFMYACVKFVICRSSLFYNTERTRKLWTIVVRKQHFMFYHHMTHPSCKSKAP